MNLVKRYVHGLLFTKPAKAARPPNQFCRFVARLDAIKIQAFVNQLPDRLPAQGGGFFQRAVARLRKGDGEARHSGYLLYCIGDLVIMHQYADAPFVGSGESDAQSWLNLQQAFDLKTTELAKAKQIEAEIKPFALAS